MSFFFRKKHERWKMLRGAKGGVYKNLECCDRFWCFILWLLQTLYDQGVRKFLIAGLPPVGCFPIQITTKLKFQLSCADDENGDAQSYNQKLISLLAKIEPTLPGAKLVYADIFSHPNHACPQAWEQLDPTMVNSHVIYCQAVFILKSRFSDQVSRHNPPG